MPRALKSFKDDPLYFGDTSIDQPQSNLADQVLLCVAVLGAVVAVTGFVVAVARFFQ